MCGRRDDRQAGGRGWCVARLEHLAGRQLHRLRLRRRRDRRGRAIRGGVDGRGGDDRCWRRLVRNGRRRFLVLRLNFSLRVGGQDGGGFLGDRVVAVAARDRQRQLSPARSKGARRTGSVGTGREEASRSAAGWPASASFGRRLRLTGGRLPGNSGSWLGGRVGLLGASHQHGRKDRIRAAAWHGGARHAPAHGPHGSGSKTQLPAREPRDIPSEGLQRSGHVDSGKRKQEQRLIGQRELL